jgi:hypothetical protein
VYELPFGRNRQFALHGPLDQIAGGWRLSTLFQWHGGVPFTPVIQGSVAGAIDPGLSPSFGAGSTLYPEQIGDPKVSNPSRSMWFNPAAFANPADGSFGNTHRNTLVGPGFANVNLSIAKEFPIHEAIALEVRADAFNFFNHINWGNPDANVGYSGGTLADTTAGQVNNPVGGTRIIQLGAHVRF